MSAKELLQENRSRGWTSVSETAPAWVRSQIIAFRAAALDGREYRMSPRQIQEAETRSALAQKAVGFVKHLLRPAASGKSYEQQFIDANGYDPWLLRMRAARQGAEIRAEQRRLSEMRVEEKIRRERIATLVEQIHDAAEGAL